MGAPPPATRHALLMRNIIADSLSPLRFDANAIGTTRVSRFHCGAHVSDSVGQRGPGRRLAGERAGQIQRFIA